MITAQLEELNLLYRSIEKGDNLAVDKFKEILKSLKAQGYSFVIKSPWDFFNINVHTTSSQNAGLLVKISEAISLTTKLFLQQRFEEAIESRELRLKLERELEGNILAEMHEPPYFQLSKYNKYIIEVRRSVPVLVTQPVLH